MVLPRRAAADSPRHNLSRMVVMLRLPPPLLVALTRLLQLLRRPLQQFLLVMVLQRLLRVWGLLTVR